MIKRLTATTTDTQVESLTALELATITGNVAAFARDVRNGTMSKLSNKPGLVQIAKSQRDWKAIKAAKKAAVLEK